MLDTLLDSSLAKKSIEFVGNVLASKWKNRKRERELFEEHRRRILSARVTNNIYLELCGLRETFLRHAWTGRSKTNQEFFDTWLSDPIVEMGWTPSGGWTRERISALHADLETVRV